jgi:hypothetical protein
MGPRDCPRMVVRKRLSLPDGYRARQVDGVWYLFDHRNVLLAGPTDAVGVEEYAWRVAWRRLEQDLNDELVALAWYDRVVDQQAGSQ